MSIDADPRDPSAWVRAARKLIDAAEAAARRARLGLVRLVPGHGYYPATWP